MSYFKKIRHWYRKGQATLCLNLWRQQVGPETILFRPKTSTCMRLKDDQLLRISGITLSPTQYI